MGRRTSKTTKTVATTTQTGRPTALTERTHETIVGAMEKGMSARAACALAGIHEATYHRWMERGRTARTTLDETGSIPEEEDRFREFCEAVLLARALAEQHAVAIVYRAMQGGAIISEEPLQTVNGDAVYDANTGQAMYKRTYSQPDGRLAMQYLSRAHAQDWSQKAAEVNARVEVTGKDGGPVVVEHTVETIVGLHERLTQVKQQQADDEKELAKVEGTQDIVDADIVDDDDLPDGLPDGVPRYDG